MVGLTTTTLLVTASCGSRTTPGEHLAICGPAERACEDAFAESFVVKEVRGTAGDANEQFDAGAECAPVRSH